MASSSTSIIDAWKQLASRRDISDHKDALSESLVGSLTAQPSATDLSAFHSAVTESLGYYQETVNEVCATDHREDTVEDRDAFDQLLEAFRVKNRSKTEEAKSAEKELQKLLFGTLTLRQESPRARAANTVNDRVLKPLQLGVDKPFLIDADNFKRPNPADANCGPCVTPCTDHDKHHHGKLDKTLAAQKQAGLI